MLMTAQFRVDDLDLDEILQQPAAEFGCRLRPKVLLRRVEVSEQS